MNKRHLHHLWRQTKSVKTWHFIVAFLVFVGISVWALRQNNLGMTKRVQAVIKADANNSNVDGALRDLGNYVTHHMNASLPNNKPIELEKSYERVVQQAYKDAESTANGDIYKKAQAVCEDPYVLLAVRAQCIQDYVTKNAKPGHEPKPLEFPPKEQYTYNFISPAFSFDLAGWSIIISCLIMLTAIGHIVVEKIIEHKLKD